MELYRPDTADRNVFLHLPWPPRRGSTSPTISIRKQQQIQQRTAHVAHNTSNTTAMSSTTARKPATGTPTRDSTTKTSASPGAANRTPARSTTPTTNGTNGVSRRQSVRSGVNGTPVSARAAARKPGAPSALGTASSQGDDNDDDAREEAAAFLQDLKERLQKAETDAEERQKQVDVLNARLDEALKEQAKLEERAHEEEEKVEGLDNEKRELIRQRRELEGIYEAERAQAMKEKEETQAREDELQETIQRLKETMAMKSGPHPPSDGEDGHLSRACESKISIPCFYCWTDN